MRLLTANKATTFKARTACLAGPPYAPSQVVWCCCSDPSAAPQENQTIFLPMGSPLHAGSRWGYCRVYAQARPEGHKRQMRGLSYVGVRIPDTGVTPQAWSSAVWRVLCARCPSATLRACSMMSPLKLFRLLLVLAPWCVTGVPAGHVFVFFWAKNLHTLSDGHVPFVPRSFVCRNTLPPFSGCRVASRSLYSRA